LKWEAEIDERGRILIPSEIRDELKFRPDQRFKIEIHGGRGVVIQPMLDPEEFIAEMKGCVAGSTIKPDKLKEIWGVDHPHH
jgi:bifunctional DNA-binding transcriptional regulator/antitoxin component of YhaV-PrlF toxin-antitoxin module